MIETAPVRTIFFDAAGTLLHLKEPVGDSYGRIASLHNLHISGEVINHSFKQAWKRLPHPLHETGPAPDDDKSWWKQLVRLTFEDALAKPIDPDILDSLFEDLYNHFAQAEAWRLYPETQHVLKTLHGRFPLYVLSNFDRRLYNILDGLEIASYFQAVILSSETGASKPHPRIFHQALAAADMLAKNCLHVGDHPECDFAGASRAGMQCILLNRPDNDLSSVLARFA